MPVEIEEVSEQPIMGRFVRCVDTVLDSIGRLGNNTFSEFEEVQTETEWLISFAMSVAKTFSHSQGAKYLGFFSPLVPSKREKILFIFAQFVYFLREVCLLFNF